MKCATIALLLLASQLGTASGQYHDPSYIMGGYGEFPWNWPMTTWRGVWVADAAKQSVRNLPPFWNNVPVFNSRSMQMDRDNRHVLIAVEGSAATSMSIFVRSGIFRIDPGTFAFTTVRADTMVLFSPGRVVINQDGDYVFDCYSLIGPYPFGGSTILRLSADGKSLTTILDGGALNGGQPRSIGRNMDTGNLLVSVVNSGYDNVVWDVAADGTRTTFAGGFLAPTCWDGYYANMQQNFDTGHIEGQSSGVLYQLQKGAKARTTLRTLGYAGGFVMQHGSAFDLQSAARKRIVAGGYAYPPPVAPAVFYIDPVPPYAVTAVDCDRNRTTGLACSVSYGLDFYRGRHLQTVKTGPGQWDLRISCPRFPGRRYVAAISLTGYRPALRLADGRKIYLVPDAVTGLSMIGALKPLFDPGAPVLDANGEATGRIDVSGLPRLDVPLWIAVAVLDPAAPGGIAYLPDTYGMRLP